MLNRDDLAVICAELGAALTRIGARLSLSTSTAVQIVNAGNATLGPTRLGAAPSPEPAAAAPVAPTAPVPATPQREAAVAGPKPTQAERVLAHAATVGSFMVADAAKALGIGKDSCRSVVYGLTRSGELVADSGRMRNRTFRLASKAPASERSVVALPTAGQAAKPAPGPTLRERLLELAANGPFTIGRAITHLQKSTQHCYNLLGDLCREGLLVRSDYSPRVYALPGQLPNAPPVEVHDQRPPAEPAMRNCLRCSKRFHSEGAHNRLCGTCSSAVSGLADTVGFSSGGRPGQVLS